MKEERGVGVGDRSKRELTALGGRVIPLICCSWGLTVGEEWM